MNLPAPPTGLYPEDYERIEAAVMETVRGRWFLLEFARRQRESETERLVRAVDRLERCVAIRVEEQEVATSDWRLPHRLVERAREFAETLRASGVDAQLCAQADALAEQFAALLDTSPAQETAPIIVAEEPPAVAVLEPYDEPASASEEIVEASFVEIEAPLEAEESGDAAIEPITVEEPEPAAEGFSEPESFDAAPIEVAAIGDSLTVSESEPETSVDDDASAEDDDVRPEAEEPNPGEIVFEEFVARAIQPEDLGEPAVAPQPVDPRLVALSRLDHLSLNEKLRLFG